MKNKKVIIPLIVFLIISIIGGIVIASNFTKKDNEIIVKDNVSVITNETENNKQPITVTDSELIFNENPNYPDGQVIVSGIIDAAPHGFIRRAIGTEQIDNKYIVKTEHATLVDVFEKAKVEMRFEITENEVKQIEKEDAKIVSNDFIDTVHATEIVDFSISKSIEKELSENTTVKGEVGYKIFVDVNFEIDKGEIIFEMIGHDFLGGQISLESSSEIPKDFPSVELFNKELPDFPFVVGGVPIVITNNIQGSFESGTSIEGEFNTTIALASESSVGFRYDSSANSIIEINEREYLSDGIRWDTSSKVKGEINGGVYLHLVTKLYDSTGADFSLGVKGKAEGEVSVSNELSEDTIYQFVDGKYSLVKSYDTTGVVPEAMENEYRISSFKEIDYKYESTTT